MGTTSKQAGKSGSGRKAPQRVTPPGEVAIAAMAADAPSHQAIAEAAYAIYEASGYQHGNDEANWLRAEAALRAVRPSTPRS